MARFTVQLPADVEGDFEVYLNGVPQEAGVDFDVEGRLVVFDRELRQDHISGWRWFLGAWGIGTYRQDDTVDVRYKAGCEVRLAHGLPISPSRDES
jgi:hypothetical protein